jgi:kanamycin kinase
MNTLPGSPGVPERLQAEYSDWAWEIAYQYAPDGLVYRLAHPEGEVRYLKLARHGGYPGIEREAARMAWASDFLPVPRVISTGVDEDVAWLCTRAVRGRDATDPSLMGDSNTLVRILARGLRLFHSAPVERCPFDFRLPQALSHARARVEAGKIDPVRDFHREFSHLSAREAVFILEQTQPSSEELVVCHGDYCLPNILIESGIPTGFVDLGELGVADRWWDLAVATWSVTWNLGPGYEDLFLEEYGVQRDPAREEFFRLLYDVAS